MTSNTVINGVTTLKSLSRAVARATLDSTEINALEGQSPAEGAPRTRRRVSTRPRGASEALHVQGRGGPTPAQGW